MAAGRRTLQDPKRFERGKWGIVTKVTKRHPDYDRLCGIERTKESDAYGEIIAPIIFLWDSPFRTHVVAVAEHDDA